MIVDQQDVKFFLFHFQFFTKNQIKYIITYNQFSLNLWLIPPDFKSIYNSIIDYKMFL